MDLKPTYQELEIQIEKLKENKENSQINSYARNGNKYRSLIDNMSEGFAHCQMIYENNKAVDFIYLEVNNAFEKLTGLKNVVGKRISEVIVDHRLENPKLFELYSRVTQTGIPEKIETYIEALELWFYISVYSSSNNQFLVVFNNITARKRGEEILRISENQFHGLFTQSHVGTAIVGLDRCIVKCNDSFCQFLGYSEEEILGKTVSYFTHSEDIEIGILEVQRMVEGEIEFAKVQKRYLRKDGLVVWGELTISLVRDNNDKPLYFLPIIQDITDRYKIEKALKESEARFKQLIKNSFDMIILIDSNGIQHFISESCEKILGYKPEELIGTPIIEKMIHPEDRESTKKGLFDIIKNNKKGGTQYRHLHKNGSWVYLEAYGNNQLDNPEIKSVVLNVRDITERHESVIALKESEIRFKKMFENHDAIMLLIEPETGLIIKANSAANKFYGYSRSELCSMMINDINMMSSEQISNARNNAISGNHNYFNFRHKLKNGDIRNVEVLSTPIEYNQQSILFSIIHDVTDKKYAEEKLKESEIKYKELVETADIAMLIDDENGFFKFFNNKFCEIFGYTRKEIEQLPIPKLVHPHDVDLVMNHHNNRLKGEKTITKYEFRGVRKNGETIHLMVSVVPVKVNGNIIGSQSYIWDISERKHAVQIIKENEIHLKEVNATKDKLFSIIAHDLRSPFNGILGFSDLLIENIKDIELAESEKYLRIIKSSAQNTLVLLDNLLNWAKLQTGQITFKPQRISLSPIISDTIELSKTSAIGKGILISQNKLDGIEVYADKNMLEIVLRNLISNAIKFTHSGGRIDVLVERKQNGVEIAISDNGVGINKETINKLFCIETNKTTTGTENEKGSGLGLILCKELVEKHGGEIWVESVLNKGSVFKFMLPMKK